MKFLKLLLDVLNGLLLVPDILRNLIHKVAIESLNSNPGDSSLLTLAQIFFLINFELSHLHVDVAVENLKVPVHIDELSE